MATVELVRCRNVTARSVSLLPYLQRRAGDNSVAELDFLANLLELNWLNSVRAELELKLSSFELELESELVGFIKLQST